VIYIDKEYFEGLRELAESAFPKRCANCGKEFQNASEYLTSTQPIRADSSGLKQSQDDEGQTIVDLFRNCICGSTLLESFSNRRNLSEDGIKNRTRFQDMVRKLVSRGFPRETARDALLNLMHGQRNDMLNLTMNKVL
jgi:hypothetical protein